MNDRKALRQFLDAMLQNEEQINDMKWHLYAELYSPINSCMDDETMRKLDDRWTAETDMPPLNDSRQWRFAMSKAGIPAMDRQSMPWRSAVQAVAEWGVSLRQPPKRKTSNRRGRPKEVTDRERDRVINIADTYASDAEAARSDPEISVSGSAICRYRKDRRRPRINL